MFHFNASVHLNNDPQKLVIVLLKTNQLCSNDT